MNILLDTDISSDVDDVGDLVVALALHKMGVINLIGVTVCTSNTKAPGCVDAICKAFGIDDMPIGTWKGAAFDPDGPGFYAVAVYDNYPHDVGLASSVQDAQTLLASLLTAYSDVTIIATGPLNNIAMLLADQLALVTAKVTELVAVAGQYPTQGAPEWNFLQDPVAANAVCANWPGLITYVGYESGANILTGTRLVASFAAEDIVRYAYTQANKQLSGRPAWGQQAFMWLLLRAGGFSVVRGANSVNASTGANTFVNNASGKDRHVVNALHTGVYQNVNDALLCSPRDGPLTVWPSYGAVR